MIDVALIQWLVVGGSIPALEVMSRNKLSMVLWPIGKAAYQTVLTAGSNFLTGFRVFENGYCILG